LCVSATPAEEAQEIIETLGLEGATSASGQN
jgi:hypothetical protein